MLVELMDDSCTQCFNFLFWVKQLDANFKLDGRNMPRVRTYRDPPRWHQPMSTSMYLLPHDAEDVRNIFRKSMCRRLERELPEPVDE